MLDDRSQETRSAFPESTSPHAPSDSLTRAGCVLVLMTAFLGWLFAGVQMAITSIGMRVAVADLLHQQQKTLETSAEHPGVPVDSEANVAEWAGWLTAAFLLGAATGGYLFGWAGDRFGRARAMALSILCYSGFSLATYFVQTPEELLTLRFLACMGVGGMWPNGIALVSEAWPNISRPFLAGAVGTAANIGILIMSVLTCYEPFHVTPDEWRWFLVVGGAPVVLGLFVWFVVPESPKWLAVRRRQDEGPLAGPSGSGTSIGDIFRPPVLRTTLLGIAIGTVPIFGGWGNSNWAMIWASKVGDVKKSASGGDSAAKPDPALKAKSMVARSLPGSISSLLGGALAMLVGRRLCYFLLAACALASGQMLFWTTTPGTQEFLIWNGLLGFFSGFFFGWLPLCLPEMFPTRVRSTGAGVSFNFGRIVTAFGVLGSAWLMRDVFRGDYAAIGKATSLIYAVGMVVILFAPDTSKSNLAE